MADIVEELTIEATPQRVWSALTQQDEIRSVVGLRGAPQTGGRLSW